VRQKAADNWCLWESATPAWPPTNGLAPRFRDPHYALAFARIVTHYVMHNAWLEDGALIAGVDVLSGVPAVLINGRYDFQSPIANAWTLKDAWRSAGLVIVDDAGHAADAPGMTRAIVQATDAFRAAR
jgi:proline iminopeptidase